MKKTILTFSLVTLILSSFAIGPFTIGLKAGISSSKITTDKPTISGYTFSDFVSDTKSGYNIGAFARFGTKVYLQPELLYCVKNGQSTSGTAIQSLKLNTIQVPVLLGIKLIDLKLASVRAFTGPAMSVVMKSSSVTYAGFSGSGSFDPKNFKNNIWDWQLGAGADIGMFTFDVRYAWGLTNVSDVDTNVANIGFSNKGNALTFSLGFKFL